MLIQTFLHFDGCCEEAVNFYSHVLGAKITDMMRFSQMPPGGGGGNGDGCPPRAMPPGNQVMYAAFEIGDTSVMASDGCEKGDKPGGFSLTVSVNTAEEADRIFAALGEGGAVKMPMTETFFSPRYGQLVDRFGVGWMVLVASGAARE